MEISHTIERPLSCLEATYDIGARGVINFFNFIFCESRLGGVIAEFICAPIVFVKSVYHYIIGRVSVDQFHIGGLNPVDLKALKPHKVAIVYIHGSMANQGSWTHMAKKMEKENIAPGFTIDLNGAAKPWNYDTSSHNYNKDIQVVENELEKLAHRYIDAGITPPKFILIGHSRGGTLAHEMCSNQYVTQVISLGSPTLYPRENVFDIEGAYDPLIRPNSQQNEENRALTRSTHMSLLYDQEVFDIVKEICEKSKAEVERYSY